MCCCTDNKHPRSLEKQIFSHIAHKPKKGGKEKTQYSKRIIKINVQGIKKITEKEDSKDMKNNANFTLCTVASNPSHCSHRNRKWSESAHWLGDVTARGRDRDSLRRTLLGK